MLPALRNQNMWCFRPISTNTPKFFTKFLVDIVSKKLANFAGGSARDFFRKEDFRNFKIVLPPQKILDVYKEMTDPLLKKLSKNYEEINLLKDLKNNLLSKLISGELKIDQMKENL